MIRDERLAAHEFLKDMVGDDYYPKPLVQKIVAILTRLCEQIEEQRPDDDAALFELTHAATEAINELQEEFWEADSDIETVAREAIAADFMRILDVYGYEVDIEDAIAPRDW